MCNCVSLTPFYQKLVIPAGPGVIERLHETPTLGFEERDDRLEAWYPADEDLGALAVELRGRVESCPAAAWDELWKSRIRPIRVGMLLVLPPWIEEEAPAETIVIRINPGMGFGTGDHATTRSCLAMLQRNVSPATSVLDFGCGSGILAIAAARLGATRVVGVDHEEAAIENARENRLLNGVTIDLRFGDAPLAGERFDLIVANIQSSVLRAHLAGLRRCLAPGGRLILSGLLDEDRFEDEIAASAVIADGPWRTYEVGATPAAMVRPR